MDAGEPAFETWLDALVDLQQQCLCRCDDPLMQARHGRGTVHGVAMLVTVGRMAPQPQKTDARAMYQVDRLIAGFR